MAPKNWQRFPPRGHKKTTIRDHALSPGEHKTLGGSYYHSIRLGVLLIGDVLDDGTIKRNKYLTEEDAFDDGFDSLAELREEATRLNPKWTLETIVFIHPATVVESLV